VPKAGVSTCNKVRLQKFDSLVGAGERGGWMLRASAFAAG